MAKQIDINGLTEFKKKCDETYAKIGQGGGSGGTSIEANPTSQATQVLEKLKIGDTTFFNGNVRTFYLNLFEADSNGNFTPALVKPIFDFANQYSTENPVTIVLNIFFGTYYSLIIAPDTIQFWGVAEKQGVFSCGVAVLKNDGTFTSVAEFSLANQEETLFASMDVSYNSKSYTAVFFISGGIVEKLFGNKEGLVSAWNKVKGTQGTYEFLLTLFQFAQKIIFGDAKGNEQMNVLSINHQGIIVANGTTLEKIIPYENIVEAFKNATITFEEL